MSIASIDIRIGGQSMDLLPGTKIKMVFQSPLFSDSLIAGDYSFPITFPLSKKNQQILDFAHVIENADPIQEYDCELYIDGVFLFNAILNISQPSSSSYQGSLKTRAGLVSSVLNNKKLAELDMDGVIAMPASGAGDRVSIYIDNNKTDFYTKYFPDTIMAFFVLLNDALYNEGLFPLTAPNTNSKWGEWFVNLPKKDDTGTPDTTVGNHIPFFYLCFILKKISEEHGFTISGDFYDDEEIRKLCVYNNFSLLIKQTSAVPYYDIEPSEINPKNHVPDILMSDFINALRNYLFIGVIVDPVTKNIEYAKLKNIINDIEYIDDTLITEPQWVINYEAFSGITLKLGAGNNALENQDEDRLSGQSYRSIVANYTALLALGGVSKGDVCLLGAENQYWIATGDSPTPGWIPFCYPELEKSTSRPLTGYTLGSPVNDLTELFLLFPTPGELRFVKELNQYWGTRTYDINPTFFWVYFTDNLFDYVLEKGGKIIETNAGTLGMSVVQLNNIGSYSSGSRKYLVPRIREAASNLYYADGITPPSLKLLFSRGLVADSSGTHYYPFGSSDVYDYAGNKLGNYSLSWAGDYGIYNVWAKDWLNFLKNTVQVNFKIHYTLMDLLNLNWKRKRRIRDVNYLIKQISVELPISGPAEVQYMKC